jgi:hypothetical protein
MNLLGNCPDRPYLGLMNAHVQSIVDKLAVAGIGSRVRLVDELYSGSSPKIEATRS